MIGDSWTSIGKPLQTIAETFAKFYSLAASYLYTKNPDYLPVDERKRIFKERKKDA